MRGCWHQSDNTTVFGGNGRRTSFGWEYIYGVGGGGGGGGGVREVNNHSLHMTVLGLA